MITAILLAAGQSKRVSTKNKLLIKYKKKILINHILDQLIKSKIQKIIIVLGHEYIKIKKLVLKNKKIKFVINKKFKTGMSSSIKEGLKKLDKKNKGFLIVQSDMPFIKKTNINKINNSLLHNRYSVHLLRFKKKTEKTIGFNISVINKFKKIKG